MTLLIDTLTSPPEEYVTDLIHLYHYTIRRMVSENIHKLADLHNGKLYYEDNEPNVHTHGIDSDPNVWDEMIVSGTCLDLARVFQRDATNLFHEGGWSIETELLPAVWKSGSYHICVGLFHRGMLQWIVDPVLDILLNVQSNKSFDHAGDSWYGVTWDSEREDEVFTVYKRYGSQIRGVYNICPWCVSDRSGDLEKATQELIPEFERPDYKGNQALRLRLHGNIEVMSPGKARTAPVPYNLSLTYGPQLVVPDTWNFLPPIMVHHNTPVTLDICYTPEKTVASLWHDHGEYPLKLTFSSLNNIRRICCESDVFNDAVAFLQTRSSKDLVE